MALIDGPPRSPQPLPFRCYVPQPGHFDWAAAQSQAEALAAELLPRLDRSRATPEGRARLRARRRAAFRTNLSNWRINRRRLREGNHSLRPIYFIWTMLNACNFHCAYCDDHMGRKYPDLPEAGRLDGAAGKRLLQVMRTGTAAVYFCGGEPTLRKDLPEMAREAARLGYFPNMINTNGSRFHEVLKKPEWSDFLTHMDIVIVSLDGLAPERLNALYAIGDSGRIASNLLLLRALRKAIPFKLAVNSVITPDNVEEVGHIVDWCRDMDIWFVPVPVNAGHRVDGGLMADPRYHALREKILERKAQGQKIIGSAPLLRRLLRGEAIGCHPTVKPHIDLTGEMIWPCKSSQHVEPARVKVTDFESVDALYAEAGGRISPHHFFGAAANQCGGQCNWMQNYTTDAYIRGLEHPIRSGFLREVREFVGRA